MKTYQITFAVPDNFDPDEMELNVGYKDELSICDEGFNSLSDSIDNFLSNSGISLEEMKLKEDSVIIFKVPVDVANSMNQSELAVYFNMIKNGLEAATGKKVMGYIDNIDVLVKNANDAIEMFNGMIAKIRLMDSIKDTTGIIVPN